MNNEVYRKARFLYKGGTPDFDSDGWYSYIDSHRRADPGISERGKVQAQKLGEYLSSHLVNQASRPVRVISSPMRRTLETILPTLMSLADFGPENFQLVVNAFYHESEGCHLKEVPGTIRYFLSLLLCISLCAYFSLSEPIDFVIEPGMNQHQIRELVSSVTSNVIFEGFSENPEDGWYVHGEGPETREQSEKRAAAFYLWLCEYLDSQLAEDEHDLFDAGVTHPSDADEFEHDKLSPRQRRRRTAVLVGHGDFMGLVLKRIVSGFGHYIGE